MDSALNTALEQPDVDHVLLKAVSHADARMRKYIWRGFRPARGGESKLMVGDKTAEDFVAEALKRLCEGIRKYDASKTLLENLNSVTDSLISSEKKTSDRTGVADYAETVTDDGIPSDPISTATSRDLSASEAAVHEELINAQRLCVKMVKAAFDGDSDMQNYLDALSEGFSKPAEIAELTNVPVNRIYEFRRKLSNFAPQFFGVGDYKTLTAKLTEGK